MPWLLLACAPFILHAPASHGQEVVGGWEGTSSRGYAFVSPAATVQRSGEFSWIVQGAVSYLYYDLPESGGTTHLRSPGESLGAAFRYSAPRITASVGAGYEVRQTTRHYASGDESRQTEHGLTFQGNVFYQVTPLTTLSGLASYGAANHYVWTRAGIKRQVSNFDNREATTLNVGAELTEQGNSDGRTTQLGGLFEVAFPHDHGSLQFRAGYSRLRNPDGSRDSKPYFGIGAYRAF
jgi:hypothetical protein